MGRFSQLGNALYEGHTSIDFVGRRKLWYLISGVIVAISLSGLLWKGLNLGIEFEGGVEYGISLPADEVNQDNVELIRDTVADTGLEGAGSPIVNTSGETRIRVQTEEMPTSDTTLITNEIAAALGIDAAEISTQEIGASWGSQVANRALTGLAVFLVLVVLFIWGYFREWKMSVAAIAALAHDVIITVGIYALSGFEVTPATVTGILTILGFSLYDTVVVFDKVNENTKDMRKSRRTYGELANLAVNQSLVRSINTSIVALLPVGALLYVAVFVLGSGSLNDLALSLFVGMAAGTYSSIFIATPLLVQLKNREKVISDADARARARVRRDADRYASVPVFSDDMPLVAEGAILTEESVDEDERRPDGTSSASTRRSATHDETLGAGRVVPSTKGPIVESGSAKRQQPSRQPRSKRK